MSFSFSFTRSLHLPLSPCLHKWKIILKIGNTNNNNNKEGKKEQQFVDLHFLCAAFLLWIITTYRLCLCLCFCRSRSHSRCSLCGQRALLLALSRSVARKCESRIAVAAAGEVLVRTLLSPHSHSPNPLRSLQQQQHQQQE